MAPTLPAASAKTETSSVDTMKAARCKKRTQVDAIFSMRRSARFLKRIYHTLTVTADEASYLELNLASCKNGLGSGIS